MAQAEVTNADKSAGGDYSESNPQYEAEAKCVVDKLYPKADEDQRKRAERFAKTLAGFTKGWAPPMAESFRRHMYAQFVPETSCFKVNKEGDPSQSKISGGDKFCGRSWVQLTHEENYKDFACFKQKLDNNGGATDSLKAAQDLTNSGACGHLDSDNKQIVSNPDSAFKYTDTGDADSTTNANENNDLASIYFFIKQSKAQPAFAKALEGTSAGDVKKVRRGVNAGDANSSKPAKDEGKSVEAFNKIRGCFKKS